jgi:glycosyltransferase involved in cell wall biosynthesis
MIYSLVIPVHNEAASLHRAVSQLLTALPTLALPVEFEVLLVENGSTDESASVCRQLAMAAPATVRAISTERPSYGEAIKRGLLESRGRYVSILECDFLDTTFVRRSFALFVVDHAELIIGSKRHPDSRDRRPLKRRALTWAFNRALNVLLQYPGSDTHGLKSIDAELARELLDHARTTDEVLQTEIVLLAWRRGIRIHELPVRIEERRATPISVHRRLPKVWRMIGQLRRSLSRIPGGPASGLRPITVTGDPVLTRPHAPAPAPLHEGPATRGTIPERSPSSHRAADHELR